MVALLERQKQAIEDTLAGASTLTLPFAQAQDGQDGLAKAVREQAASKAQFERDRKYMDQRLAAIENELTTEPQQIRDGYEVVLDRFEPVGLVYLWPRS